MLTRRLTMELNVKAAREFQIALLLKERERPKTPNRRRSNRKKASDIELEKRWLIEMAIDQECQDGLNVGRFPRKGRGIRTTRPFAKDEFVCEYIGEYIDGNEADRREKEYAENSKIGCYMNWFLWRSKRFCIDATRETHHYGRLLNHSRTGNLTQTVYYYRSRPHLIFLANRDIPRNVELTYDYGDRSKQSLLHHKWLAK